MYKKNIFVFCLAVITVLLLFADRAGLKKQEVSVIVSDRRSYMSAIDGWFFRKIFIVEFKIEGEKYSAIIPFEFECYEKTEVENEIYLEYVRSRILRNIDFQCMK